MNGFLWTFGHLGWGIFAVLVFSGLWLLLSDLCWRLLAICIGRLLALLAIGWMLGIGCIVFGFYMAG